MSISIFFEELSEECMNQTIPKQTRIEIEEFVSIIIKNKKNVTTDADCVLKCYDGIFSINFGEDSEALIKLNDLNPPPLKLPKIYKIDENHGRRPGPRPSSKAQPNMRPKLGALRRANSPRASKIS